MSAPKPFGLLKRLSRFIMAGRSCQAGWRTQQVHVTLVGVRQARGWSSAGHLSLLVPDEGRGESGGVWGAVVGAPIGVLVSHQVPSCGGVSGQGLEAAHQATSPAVRRTWPSAES